MTTNEPNNHGLYVPKKSRRDFLRGGIAAGTGLAMSSATHAFAAGGDEIKIGLIGCGGRGSGAAGQALSSGNYNFKLWAMGDAHQDRLDSAAKNLAQQAQGSVRRD